MADESIASPGLSKMGTFRRSPTRATDAMIPSDQLKRVLALVENNSSAMALLGESVSSLMLRVQTLERGSTKRGDHMLTPSVMRGSALPSALTSKNNYSALNSAEGSQPRAMPLSMERRKVSIGQRATPDRAGMPRAGSQLPDTIQGAVGPDPDLALLELSATSKRS